jgi:hypothetical protein
VLWALALLAGPSIASRPAAVIIVAKKTIILRLFLMIHPFV